MKLSTVLLRRAGMRGPGPVRVGQPSSSKLTSRLLRSRCSPALCSLTSESSRSGETTESIDDLLTDPPTSGALQPKSLLDAFSLLAQTIVKAWATGDSENLTESSESSKISPKPKKKRKHAEQDQYVLIASGSAPRECKSGWLLCRTPPV